jgi:hypothetical protein
MSLREFIKVPLLCQEKKRLLCAESGKKCNTKTGKCIKQEEEKE